jgi:ABC-type multidrug transport system ATPase subunit
VDARGVWKRYGGTWALRALDLQVGTGEGVGLVGPNGSGKTTLLKVLATATGPSRGDVLVFGASVRDAGEVVRRCVGLCVAQSYVYGELTGVENLRFAATMYGLATPAADLRGRLARVGLSGAADARVRTYSQGMLQRLSLARATLIPADLVLLDEPYTALDAGGLDLVDDVIRELRAAGRTLIMATHRLDRAAVHCERVVALDRGRVAFDGPAAAAPRVTAAAPGVAS